MPKLAQNLILPRCPHCAVANPNLYKNHNLETHDHQNQNKRTWTVYVCGRCGGVVLAAAPGWQQDVAELYPTAASAKEDIPERPRSYLQQAMDSLHAPAGAVMLAASAVDSMLKLKGYVEGTLYARIEKAKADHLITSEMAEWAHDVRLDANDQRHADEGAALPTAEDARRTLDFAAALAEFLFVLPQRVTRGISSAKTAG